MQIKKFKTKFHHFLFQFDYAPFIVEKLKEFQKDNSNGWKGLNFFDDKEGNIGWVFSSFEVFKLINEEFEPFVEDNVEEEMEEIKNREEEIENRLEKLDSIDKEELNKDLEVKTLKPLFNFQKEAVDFVDKVGGKALIADDMGCLEANTDIIVNEKGKSYHLKIDKLFKLFNCCSLDRIIKTRSLNEETGMFELNEIKKVLYKGKKETVKIKTKSGKELILTHDHKLFSEEKKWVEVGKFKVGDKIFINGQQICKKCGSKKGIITYKYAKFKGLCKKCVYKYYRKNHKQFWSKRRISKTDGYVYLKGKKYHNHPRYTTGGLLEHILVLEKKLGRYITKKERVHHINEIRSDNRIENLKLLKSESEHNLIHNKRKNFDKGKGLFIPKLDRIIEIENNGIEEVYDIVMADPHRNFIANGIVVHNCGKTIEAIGYAVLKNYGRVLVICPASVKENWKREILAFSGVSANILTDTKERGGWEIIGYPNLDKYWNYIRKEPYQLIIIDEAHYIKNKKAIRTRKTLTLLKKAKDIIFLTGTPILNRPHEIYNIYNFIRPMDFWGDDGFARRYCGLVQDSYGRWDYTGATNLDELKEKMSFMIRRKKEDVIEELPDKTINVLETKMNNWKDYKAILSDFKKWLKDKKLNESAVFAEALTKVNYLKQVVVENKNIKAELDNLLESGKKIIVFSQYKTVIDKLYEQYKEQAVKLTGGTPTNDRQEAIDRFQQEGDCRIFFSTIKAGGVGITLTEADTVLFTDLEWTPANHHQAEDRAYRIGQKNNVNVYYLITPKTLEEEIWKMLKRKETMINKIMEGEKTNKVHIKTLIKNL